MENGYVVDLILPRTSVPKNTDKQDTDTQNSAYPVYG